MLRLGREWPPRCHSCGRAALHRVGWPLFSRYGHSRPAPPSPAGIIDLSQVPHLPVLVPPTPGTPATAMDRLAYLPTTPQHFSSRLSSSPLSPGNNPAPILGQDPGVRGRCLSIFREMPCTCCSTPEAKSRPFLNPGAESHTFWFPGGPSHLTKPTATSSSERERERDRDRDREREREREKSILTSTTTVEHAPIWRPGRPSETPARSPGGPHGPRDACSL